MRMFILLNENVKLLAIVKKNNYIISTSLNKYK